MVLQEKLMDKTEYLNRAMEVTDLSLRDAVNNKAIAFQRLKGFMELRDQLTMKNATQDDVRRFLMKHKRIVGKRNETDGKGFCIYDTDDPQAVKRIMEDAPDVLEDYIVQHREISRIYPLSVNTLRIHTVRNAREIRTVLNPILSIGASGSVTDHPLCSKALRIILNDEGRIIAGVDRWRCFEKMNFHPDTGYRVAPGYVLPFVPEACELCRKAAMRFPELRYLGWDVAITEKGPVIVEVNGISGLPPKYCGFQELTEMFRFIADGAEFCCKPLIRAGRFAPEVEGMPDSSETYLFCLQSALHRRGIEFTGRNIEDSDCFEELECIFALDEKRNCLSAEIKGAQESVFSLERDLADAEESDLFSIEQIAEKRAEEIYTRLRKTAEG